MRQRQAAVKEITCMKRSVQLLCQVKLRCVKKLWNKPIGVYSYFLFSKRKERKKKKSGRERPAKLCVKNSSSQLSNTPSQLTGKEVNKEKCSFN